MRVTAGSGRSCGRGVEVTDSNGAGWASVATECHHHPGDLWRQTLTGSETLTESRTDVKTGLLGGSGGEVTGNEETGTGSCVPCVPAARLSLADVC